MQLHVLSTFMSLFPTSQALLIALRGANGIESELLSNGVVVFLKLGHHFKWIHIHYPYPISSCQKVYHIL